MPFDGLGGSAAVSTRGGNAPAWFRLLQMRCRMRTEGRESRGKDA